MPTGRIWWQLCLCYMQAWCTTTRPIVALTVQVVLASGTTQQELDADLQERLADAEHQQDTDASLNSILVLSAQAEIDQLRSTVAASAQVHIIFLSHAHHGACNCSRGPCAIVLCWLHKLTIWGAAGPYTASSNTQV